MARQRRITILGSGNVATHIAGGLQAAGCHITEVCSRSLSNAGRLSESLHDCRPLDNPAKLATDSDLYIIACSDSAISDIAVTMPRVEGIVVHTSGSVPLSVLAPSSSRYGVLYPLQTFSRESDVDLQKVPFFTEASDPTTLHETDSYARMLSGRIFHADSRQRTILHIAGVLSCNFVNHLWQLTQEILGAEGYSLDVVRPLIEATLDKAMAIGPYKAQTGPAVRGDMATIERHTDILPSDTAGIYRILSESIIQSHRK